jgi:hypothetical protein
VSFTNFFKLWRRGKLTLLWQLERLLAPVYRAFFAAWLGFAQG